MTDAGTVLRESSETAARQRARLEASAGRTRVVAALHRVPLVARYLGGDDAARSGLRYQPVAWTVIALAAVAFWFPGRDDGGDVAESPAPSAPAVAAQSPTPAAAPGSPSAAAARPPVAIPSAPVARPAPSTATVTPAAPATATAEPGRPMPAEVALHVRGFGWAAALSGSGLSTADVPDGTMPVANRLGRQDKISFVRLAGQSTTLALTEDPGGAREAIGAGAVVACPITDAGWREEPDQPLDDAPPWNADACVVGTEADGTWSFDLSPYADVAGDAGFALVPDPSAPADFQVTFAAS